MFSCVEELRAREEGSFGQSPSENVNQHVDHYNLSHRDGKLSLSFRDEYI